MPRKPKLPDPKQYDAQIERLWDWLVKNAGADKAVNRDFEATGIMANARNDPKDLRASVARVFMFLRHAMLERHLLMYAHRFRAEVAVAHQQAGAELRRLLRAFELFAKEARATQGVTRHVRHWPSDFANRLDAKIPGFVVAAHLIDDFAGTINVGIAEHSIDLDTKRTVLDNMDNAALMLRDGRMKYAEIAGLLDDQRPGGNNPHIPHSIVNRWKQRVARARRRRRTEKSRDRDIAARTSSSSPPASAEPQSRSHGRQEVSGKNRARRRRSDR